MPTIERTLLTVILCSLLINSPTLASEKIKNFGEKGVYVAGVGAGASTVEGLVVGPGSASAAAGLAASGITAGLASLTWLVGEVCGGEIPLSTCNLPPGMVAAVDKINPTKRFIAKIPSKAALLSAAKSSTFTNTSLGEPTISYLEAFSELLGATIGWTGTALNMAAAEKLGRKDLLLRQGQFLQDYAREIEIKVEKAIAASLSFGKAFREFHESEGICITPGMVRRETERFERAGFTRIQRDVLRLFGFNARAIALIRDTNLKVLSAGDSSLVATHDFTKLAEALPDFVKGVIEETEKSVAYIKR